MLNSWLTEGVGSRSRYRCKAGSTVVFDSWLDKNLASGFDLNRSVAVTLAQPETVKGRQLTNAEPHTLDFHVRLIPPEARILVRLDGRTLTAWQGPLAGLTPSLYWPARPPNQLAVGTQQGGWVVTEVKVKRQPTSVPTP